MSENNESFIKFLSRQKVSIPQIQRDYAQGREMEADKRKHFVAKLLEAISGDCKDLHLDFIYGYTLKDKDVFVPLDGQQRLTTLWLLHFILTPKNEADYLSNFSYETRVSSRRFCKGLINSQCDFEKSLKTQIEDAAWFMSSWKNDPTVKSMLTMLEYLQKELSGINREKAYEALKNEKITFSCIDIKSEAFKLTDQLYIKMNSRGKMLTNFENLKAQFTKLLGSEENNWNKGDVDYKHYFSIKIDTEWTDIFWAYKEKVEQTLKDEKKEINESVVDICIKNFIDYIAGFLFFKDKDYDKITREDLPPEFELWEAVFGKTKDNVDFLFDAFDFFVKLKGELPIKQAIEGFFDKLFSNINTFDSNEKDLFFRAITPKLFDVKEKVLLYAIVRYCSQLAKYDVDENLKDFVRIVRNLLFALRQPDKNKSEFALRLRETYASQYCKFIDTFIDGIKNNSSKTVYEILAENKFSSFSSIEHEQAKARIIVKNPNLKSELHKLEDNNEIRGWLVNFDLESSKLSDRIKAFQDVWSGEVKDSFIVRALLVYGDYKVCTRENTALGKMHYFGGKEGWYRILTEKNEDRKNILENFLDAFNEIKEGDINDKLQKLIDNYKFENKDWKYYFIKYSAITEEYNGFPCLYFWRGNGFEIERLRKDSPKPSVAKHINPYLIALKEKIDSERVKLYEERYDRPSYLSIDDGELKIYCKENGWQIEKNGSSSPENVPKDEDRIQFAAKIIKSKLTLKDYVPSSA